MTDFAALRRTMVDGQVRTADVTDRALLDALMMVPREQFLPPERAALAYLDLDAPVDARVRGESVRRLLKPMVLAKMIQAAAIGPDDQILDVGCATGYGAAVLASLARSVIALEVDPELARRAQAAIAECGAAAITVVVGALERGAPAHAPFDAIVLEGAVEMEPNGLFAQLADGGRLVCVLGAGQAGKAMLYRRTGAEVSGRALFDAAAPVLPGFAATPAFVF